MMFEEGHPIISLSAWKGFCAWEKSLKGFPSRLIDEMVDRNECGCLPDWFVPLAYGVAIASDALLRKAGHPDGLYRPRGWQEARPRLLLPGHRRPRWSLGG